MTNNPPVKSQMPDSPSRKNLQQCFNIEKNVTLRIQLSNAKDIQSALIAISNEPCISEESELRFVKEQLRNTEKNTAYLSDRVKTYRDRWLEEYYRANNLEHHMPSGIHVADLAQIPEGASSPTLFPEYLYGDDEGLEREEHDGEVSLSSAEHV
ncbi:hypothetical protein DFH29DRAFT_875436 [Suillus ampliporus]|nr:hypothetical protein DFH29DRAFT_875436 [Suillus ampliporus]